MHFLLSVALHGTLVNIANILIHATLDPVRDVKTAERVRLALKMVLRFSHAHVLLVLQHRCAKYMRKMHVIHHHVNMVVHVI